MLTAMSADRLRDLLAIYNSMNLSRLPAEMQRAARQDRASVVREIERRKRNDAEFAATARAFGKSETYIQRNTEAA